MTTPEALDQISAIREDQNLEHGDDQHSLPEWILITRRQLQKAEDAWYEGKRTEAMTRMAHVGACACASIEQSED